ncbi:MAG: hypothetical protein M0P77_06980 [Firmicutes bacterium]|nr:hypothetical protein [Bacillota bacterium]
MRKFYILIVVLLILMQIFTACAPKPIDNTEELKEKDDKIEELEREIKDLEAEIIKLSSTNNLVTQTMDVILLIKRKDMKTLSQYVHPIKGIRFTPYFYVDTQQDKVFTAQEVSGLMHDSQVMRWGFYDGSGNPIDLTFSDYYDKFVYDKDFANPHVIGNNVAIGGGNTIDNIREAYPEGYFLEFHFSQFDPQFSGIDWESLRLVFEKHDNTWYLVGIIHGQWTI